MIRSLRTRIADVRRATIAVALAIVLTGCAADVAPEWCVAEGGATTRFADEPARWTSAPELNVAWRIDGSAAGRELLAPTSVAISSTGRIAIADLRLQEVVVIGEDGTWIGRWGRAGRGPGEFMAPFAAAWRPDGSLTVYDPAASRLVVFDSVGNTLEDEPVETAFTAALGGGARYIELTASGVLIALPNISFRGEGPVRTVVVVRGGLPGTAVDTLLRAEAGVVEIPVAGPLLLPGSQIPLAAAQGDTILALAGESPRYLVRIFRNGRLSHVICRNVDPLPFTDEEARPIEPNVPDEVAAGLRAVDPPEMLAPIGRLVIDAAGRLWVQRDRPRILSGLDFVMGRPGALHDVFDSDGAYLGEVRMPPNVRFLGATQDLVIGLEASDLDVLSVVAYRLE